MNPSLPANAAIPHDRYTAALQINSETLDRDLNAITRTYQETIQLQQEAQSGLQDKVSLLEAQLADARRDQERMRAELEASRTAAAAMVRQNASQQAELKRMSPRDALLNRLVIRVQELNRMGVPDFNDRYQVYLNGGWDSETAEGFRQTEKLLWLQEQWKPIIAELVKQNH